MPDGTEAADRRHPAGLSGLQGAECRHRRGEGPSRAEPRGLERVSSEDRCPELARLRLIQEHLAVGVRGERGVRWRLAGGRRGRRVRNPDWAFRGSAVSRLIGCRPTPCRR